MQALGRWQEKAGRLTPQPFLRANPSAKAPIAGATFQLVRPVSPRTGAQRQLPAARGTVEEWKDELPKSGQYEIGSLAMANAGPNTNGSQFFLISGSDGVRLPPLYALFGKVVKGLDVVEAMQNVPTGPGDRPRTDVVINSVTISVAD